MENTAKRQAILFIRVDAYEVYFDSEIKEYRRKTLEIYCIENNIDIVSCHWLIAQCECFEDDFLSGLKQNIYGSTQQIDLLLMHDSYEISEGIITAANLITQVKQLGLELVFIKDFAIKIGRY